MSESEDYDIVKPQKIQGMTGYEHNLLLDLVNRYKDIIENKKPDSKTVQIKAKAWKEIEKIFCSDANTTYRTASQLRTRWKNCKLRSKQHYIDTGKKLEKDKTVEGGRARSSGSKSNGIEVSEVMSPCSVPLTNPFVDEDEADEDIEDTEMIAMSYPITIEQKHVPTESQAPNKATGFNGIEFEEHQIRLKILATELETAQILKQKAQMDLTFLSNEHQLRMQLLSAQLGNTSQSILP